MTVSMAMTMTVPMFRVFGYELVPAQVHRCKVSALADRRQQVFVTSWS